MAIDNGPGQVSGMPPGTDLDSPVFVISVAAELAGLHAQTLRGYDRLGLVRPGRSAGGGVATRRGTSPCCARCSGFPRTKASTSPG